MTSHPSPWRTLSIWAFLLLNVGFACEAQQAPAPLPSGLVWLTDGWRYHSGDNIAWANPQFDDGDWERHSPEQTDTCAHGCWYRLPIELPPHGNTPLDLLMLAQSGVFEVYVDGHRAGSAHFEPWWLSRETLEFVVPLNAHRDSVLLAIRIHPPRIAFDANEAASLRVALGGQQAISDAADAHHARRVIRFLPSGAVSFVIVLAGFAVLLVFALQQRDREYLWLGIYLTILGSSWGIFTAAVYAIIPGDANEIYADPAIFLGMLAQTEFTFAFIRRRPNRLWRSYECFLLACPILSFLCSAGLVRNALYFSFESAALVPAALAIPALLFYWHRHGNREARWLIVPSLAPAVGMILVNLPQIGSLLGRNLDFLSGPVLLWGIAPLSPADVADAIFLLAIGAVMLVRFTTLNREQARVSGELAAAREMQLELVPATLPALPGWRLDAAYIPASEVGGDFYQVVSRNDGSSLLIVGDVSGKGLKAAMTGALAIGAFRSLASEGLSPGVLLTRLNESLCGASHGGFVTCLCGHTSHKGRLTLANAGHVPPYWNGEEIPLESGLPLGIVSDLEYPETTVDLAPGDRTVIVTDGVVEAQSPSGELFGFARTQVISVHPVAQIAAAAQAFGQQDDITVLSLTRQCTHP